MTKFTTPDSWYECDWENVDPWDEWRAGARDHLAEDAEKFMTGAFEDRGWSDEDEDRYLAAMLVAGQEPGNYEWDAHAAWQRRACTVLMVKYHDHWWWPWSTGRKTGDPRYRHKARTCRASVQVDELCKFYAWVCKQRRESWAKNL